ncbi:hypothetical protein AMECASPLE_001200 [Ameca splendens]|uniref:Secreted protein n=1 Tax=Ameca splendens TaxID=208324 RepID=A0ABV0XAX0_9TELE
MSLQTLALFAFFYCGVPSASSPVSSIPVFHVAFSRDAEVKVQFIMLNWFPAAQKRISVGLRSCQVYHCLFPQKECLNSPPSGRQKTSARRGLSSMQGILVTTRKSGVSTIQDHIG